MKRPQAQTRHTLYGIQMLKAMIFLLAATLGIAEAKITVCVTPGNSDQVVEVSVGSLAAADALMRLEGSYYPAPDTSCSDVPTFDCPCNGLTTIDGITWSTEFFANSCKDNRETDDLTQLLQVTNHIQNMYMDKSLSVQADAQFTDEISCAITSWISANSISVNKLGPEAVAQCRAELDYIIEQNSLTCSTVGYE